MVSLKNRSTNIKPSNIIQFISEHLDKKVQIDAMCNDFLKDFDRIDNSIFLTGRPNRLPPQEFCKVRILDLSYSFSLIMNFHDFHLSYADVIKSFEFINTFSDYNLL